jgi:hypothetical protein
VQDSAIVVGALERAGGIPTIAVLDRIAEALHTTLTVSMTPAA